MKSFILTMSILSVMSFSTCSKDYLPTYLESISTHVKEAENVLSIYDKSVQEALDGNQSSTIPLLSKNASIAIAIKMERVQELPTNEKTRELYNAALEYVEAMFEMIKAEEVYEHYSITTTLEEAKEMDSLNVKAKKNLERKHQIFLTAKNKLKAEIEE